MGGSSSDISPSDSDQVAGARLGAGLWGLANTLRAAGVRPAEYQAFIIPLLSAKLVCERAELLAVADPAVSIPPGCTLAELADARAQLGRITHKAFGRIERANPGLSGAFLDTDFGRLSDDTMRALFTQLGALDLTPAQLTQDALGQAYEYLLGQFADDAGAKAGQYFTPSSVAELLVRLTDPKSGESVYDPACGSGGLLDRAAQHVAATGSARASVHLFGQELDSQSYAIARINLLVHGDHACIRHGDTLAAPAFVDQGSLQRFDVVVANPPFGLENTAARTWETDPYGRAQWGPVVRKPSELAFVAHVASSLRRGSRGATARAAVVLPLGALSRRGREAEMRQALLEAGLVQSVVALPERLFYNTPIPAAVLVLRAGKPTPTVQFVDASACGTPGRRRNVLSSEHLDAIAQTCQSATPCSPVRMTQVPVTEIIAAGSDWSVHRWLADDPVDAAADRREVLAELRAAERASSRSRRALWALLDETGYHR